MKAGKIHNDIFYKSYIIKNNKAMISRIIYLKISLLLALLSLSLFAFAQAQKSDKSSLQGKWVLEDVVVRNGDDIVNIDMDSIGFEACTQIEFNKDEMTVIHKKHTEKGEYTLESNFLNPKISVLPVSIGFRMSEKKLYLEHYEDVTDSQGNLKVLTITFSYKRK